MGLKKINEQELKGEGYMQPKGVTCLPTKVKRLQPGDEFIERPDYLARGGSSVFEESKKQWPLFSTFSICGKQ
ncbi:MAG TPA: hypothetical protein PLA68_03890 [Panacibacter sp.]|nr:hypothetical protein [Panacibacter sp.]